MSTGDKRLRNWEHYARKNIWNHPSAVFRYFEVRSPGGDLIARMGGDDRLNDAALKAIETGGIVISLDILGSCCEAGKDFGPPLHSEEVFRSIEGMK